MGHNPRPTIQLAGQPRRRISQGLAALIQRWLPKEVAGLAAFFRFGGIRTYSAAGEDIQIERLLGQKTGFFVDVGAFHPSFISNTYRLYRRGWRGINIDVDDYKIRLFHLLRPRDISVQVGVSDTPGEAEFFFQSGPTYGSMAGLNRESVAESAEIMQREVRSRTIQVRPLNDILEEHLPRDAQGRPMAIDLLNIDVEKFEYPILRRFDFQRFPVKLLAVEMHADRIDDLLHLPAYQLLSEQGYDLAAWTPPTAIFERRDCAAARAAA
jgi:hypothetical protein